MGLLVFKADSGACLYMNKQAAESLEIPFQERREAIELALRDLLSVGAGGGGGSLRPFTADMLNDEGLLQDVAVPKKNGHFMIVNIGIKHVAQSPDGPLIAIMFQDITIQRRLQREVQSKQEEIHKAYSELLEQNRQLRELDHAKDRFIALTTHELRTPLAAIVSTAEFLNMRFYESEEQKEELIQTIHEQALHLMDLVNDVLDFAKIRAGKMDYFVEHFELKPLVWKLAGAFQQMASASGVTVNVECDCEPDPTDGPGGIRVYADVLRIKEVINNVVNNAIKYNRAGGSVRISFEVLPRSVRVRVCDTGSGIPADKLSHVFNEFETVGTLARHHKGTGLGMPISKRLMLEMGGDLTFESVEGVGSTFFIEIPTEKVLDPSVYRSRPEADEDLAA